MNLKDVSVPGPASLSASHLSRGVPLCPTTDILPTLMPCLTTQAQKEQSQMAMDGHSRDNELK